MSSSFSARTLPLCVDLDCTLLRIDTLEEAGVAAIGALRLGAIAAGLLAGRAALKRRLAAIAPFDPAQLPYNAELLAWLRAERAAGRRLMLATAADASVAQRIADHLGLFDAVIASDGTQNLKGAAKAKALVARFGPRGFAYAGDSRSDLAVWREAGSAVLVGTTPAVAREARASCPVEREFPRPGGAWRAGLRALRPHQWVKNLLVFVPILTAGAIDSLASWRGGLVAFIAFCATASAIYLVNDLLDVQADRAHPRKRLRPFASGALRPVHGAALGGVLGALGLAAAQAAGILPVIAVYALASVAYSVRLKELPLVDVFVLTFLYTVRMFGGGEATGHRLSLWLLAFSVFLFLGLAFIKRTEELMSMRAGSRAGRRGYTTADLPVLQMFGIGAAFAASLTLALFVQNVATAESYASPALLWGVVPLILFWQCRMWLSAARGYMHHDPIVYASRDWVSWLVALCTVILLTAARNMAVFAY
jgi:4-hydroxybenzoate polyprenyltransferase/phosphoserine phosphatase